MSSNYHANQFENAFKPTRLKNWEVPKYNYPDRPQQQTQKKPTVIISDSNGRLLPNVPRSSKSPWGNFKNTWEIPCHINRKKAEEICNQLVKNKEVKCRKKNTEQTESHNVEDQIQTEEIRDEQSNLKYKPGDICKPNQYKEEKIDISTSPLNPLYLEKHQCDNSVIEANEFENTAPRETFECNKLNSTENMRQLNRSIPDKPNEQYPSFPAPAYYNFQLAKKMHQENLEHKPLPDSVLDKAFQKLQLQRSSTPGLILDVIPQASGVGIKTYKAGPTHCTKMKVYRPKTCGVIPKAISDSFHRPKTSLPVEKKIGSMDLAICWDYRPKTPIDEPKPPKHIDGSNGSAAPAVFTLVKTPRTPEQMDTGRSGGLFTNTLGEPGFFDKDISLRKASFTQQAKSNLKCSCGTSPINCGINENNINGKPKSAYRTKENKFIEKAKRSQSSPNLSLLAISENLSSKKDNEKNYHEKRRTHTCSKYRKLSNNESGFQFHVEKGRIKSSKSDHDIKIYPEITMKTEYKQKINIPKHDLLTNARYSDSGCSTMSTTSKSCSTKILHVPKPRHPYSKKNYNIETLVPPFTCIKGGAGQGGYPEHWRLASVYQHSYKPVQQRKYPLLQTIYK